MLPSSSEKIPLICSANSCKRDLLTFSVDLLLRFFNTAIYKLLAKQIMKNCESLVKLPRSRHRSRPESASVDQAGVVR